MKHGRNDSATLDDPRLPARLKLALGWTSVMFLYAYVDIIGFFKPGVVDDILDERVWEFEISEALLVTFLALMAVPIFMVVLTIALPARAGRMTNLIVAAVQIPYAGFNVLGESWVAYYGLGFVLELIVFALILRWAWSWPRQTDVVAA